LTLKLSTNLANASIIQTRRIGKVLARTPFSPSDCFAIIFQSFFLTIPQHIRLAFLKSCWFSRYFGETLSGFQLAYGAL
jgi:hypothetical protein